MKRVYKLITLLCCIILLSACQNHNQNRQSPINIPAATLICKHQLPALQFHFKPVPLEIGNEANKRIKLFFKKNTGNFAIFEGKDYQLINIHFHSPSPHAFNGKRFPMAVHYVFYGKKAKHYFVMEVPIIVGRPNQTFDTILTHLPKASKKSMLQVGEGEILAGIKINAVDFLPQNHAYFLYHGSLIFPPYTQNLTYWIMSHPITLSEAQIKAYRAAVKNASVRDLQPLGMRKIQCGKV